MSRKIVECRRENKGTEKGRSITTKKEEEVTKEVSIQELIEDDLEKFGEKFKEVKK